MLPIECHQVARIRHQERIDAAHVPGPAWAAFERPRSADRSVRLTLGARLVAWLATPLASRAGSRKVSEPVSTHVVASSRF
jgi:hypothetical protein